jgi:hypothetical protein
MPLLTVLATLMQRPPVPAPFQKVLDFLDTPLPYSPFTEYFAVLFVLWLLARRGERRVTFDSKAQEVLDAKLAAGEIDKKTYDRYRQEMSLRPKRG